MSSITNRLVDLAQENGQETLLTLLEQLIVLTTLVQVPHLDELEPKSAQTPEQQAGIVPVQGAVEQEPQNFGSICTLVQVP